MDKKIESGIRPLLPIIYISTAKINKSLCGKQIEYRTIVVIYIVIKENMFFSGCRRWCVLLLLVIATQVFLTTYIKNSFLLEYFDAVAVISKVLTDDDAISEDIPNDISDYYKSDYYKRNALQIIQEETKNRETGDESKRQRNNNKYNTKNQSRDTYDGDSKRQRIVILAGPHKTASTTLQEFFSDFAGKTVKVRTDSKLAYRNVPYKANTEWVWPIGVKNEYDGEENRTPVPGTAMRTPRESRKFYAILAAYISARRLAWYFPEWENDESAEARTRLLRGIRDYFRSLFRHPWEEGKNLVIGAEAFDSVVQHLRRNGVHENDGNSNSNIDLGEELHVSPYSDKMIDNLLDLFPWDGNNSTSSSLRLDDIEVHVNFRTPRVSHAISIWHQLGLTLTLRQYLVKKALDELYQSNSLALALQYVRKGIKTTIVDMAGVKEKEVHEKGENESKSKSDGKTKKKKEDVVVGGLQGVVACEILRMDSLCDDTSKLHLPGYKIAVENINLKSDKGEHNLTDEQLEEIDRVMNEYDCGVWQHLRKYQEKGLLRILHPSKNLFSTCNPEGDKDMSFYEMLQRIREIDIRDNGIPLSAKERKVLREKDPFLQKHQTQSAEELAFIRDWKW